MDRDVVATVVGWLLWSTALAVWSVGGLFAVAQLHAAFTGYWGSEWRVERGDAVTVAVAWVLVGIGLGAWWNGLRRAPAPASVPTPSLPPELRRQVRLVVELAATVLVAGAVLAGC